MFQYLTYWESYLVSKKPKETLTMETEIFNTTTHYVDPEILTKIQGSPEEEWMQFILED